MGANAESSGAEPDRFDDYVASRGADLVRFGYLLVRDHHLAEDLAQEGLARLHRHWPRVRSQGNPDAYVRKVMLNQLLSWRRRRSWSERPMSEPPDAPTESWERFGDRDEMWQLLGTLPPKQRAVIVLRYYESLTDAEIATVVGCSAATVRSHASKALTRLRAASADDLTQGARHD